MAVVADAHRQHCILPPVLHTRPGAPHDLALVRPTLSQRLPAALKACPYTQPGSLRGWLSLCPALHPQPSPSFEGPSLDMCPFH